MPRAPAIRASVSRPSKSFAQSARSSSVIRAPAELAVRWVVVHGDDPGAQAKDEEVQALRSCGGAVDERHRAAVLTLVGVQPGRGPSSAVARSEPIRSMTKSRCDLPFLTRRKPGPAVGSDVLRGHIDVGGNAKLDPRPSGKSERDDIGCGLLELGGGCRCRRTGELECASGWRGALEPTARAGQRVLWATLRAIRGARLDLRPAREKGPQDLTGEHTFV